MERMWSNCAIMASKSTDEGAAGEAEAARFSRPWSESSNLALLALMASVETETTGTWPASVTVCFFNLPMWAKVCKTWAMILKTTTTTVMKRPVFRIEGSRSTLVAMISPSGVWPPGYVADGAIPGNGGSWNPMAPSAPEQIKTINFNLKSINPSQIKVNDFN